MADNSVDFDSLLDDGDDSFLLAIEEEQMPSLTAKIIHRKPGQGPPSSSQFKGVAGGGASTILREPKGILLGKKRVGDGESERKRLRVAEEHERNGIVAKDIGSNGPAMNGSATNGRAGHRPQQQVINGKNKEWANPNPFMTTTERRTTENSIRRGQDDEEEDDTPIIEMKDDGGYTVAKMTALVSNEAVTTRDLSALDRWGRSTTSSKSNNANADAAGAARNIAAVSNALNSASASASASRPRAPTVTTTAPASSGDSSELDRLRKQTAKLEAALKEKQAEIDQAKLNLTAKQGEIVVVRGRLKRAETASLASVAEEKRLKAVLTERLEAQEKEHRAMMEKMRVEQAFARNEQESSRRLNSSQRPGASQRKGSMAPPQHPYIQSPSLNRGRGGAQGPRPEPTPRKKFGGFVNSFDGSPRPSSTGKSIRILPRTRFPTMSSPPSRKLDTGKGKMLIEEEEDSMAIDGEDSRYDDEMDEYEADEVARQDFESLDANNGRDWRTEILSALFTHMTYVHYDTQSATAPASSLSTQRASTSTARASFAASSHYSTLRRGNAASSRTSGYNTDVETDVLPTLPVPTLHAITNLKFPLSVPSNLSLTYEDTCRDLFAVLGRRSEASFESEYGEVDYLVRGIGGAFETLIETLDKAAMIGPLINLLSLISHLVLLFPQFSRHFLNDPFGLHTSIERFDGSSAMLPQIAKIVVRYGQYVEPRAETEPNPLKNKVKERSRRIRGVVTRINGSVQAAEASLDRVDVEASKRNALLSAAGELLQALAWKSSAAGEEAFVGFLGTTEVVDILLDPRHPTALLLTTTRFVALLSCRSSLFRKIINVKFDRAGSSKVPLLDRLGALLSLGGIKDPLSSTYELHLIVLSLLSILLTRHADALVLFRSSPSLIPDILDKLFKDTRTLWDYDGSDLSDITNSRLQKVLARLSASVHLFYYLTCAPSSPLKVGEWFIESSYSGLHDRFNVAFGSLAFASTPDWADGSEQGNELIRLSFLAQEIMEDVSPQEADEMEQCFAIPVEEDEAKEVDDRDQGFDEDEEMMIRDMSQGGN